MFKAMHTHLQFEDHGPFQSLNKLWNHNAYLAVFMNYIISNCDSSSIVSMSLFTGGHLIKPSIPTRGQTIRWID